MFIKLTEKNRTKSEQKVDKAIILKLIFCRDGNQSDLLSNLAEINRKRKRNLKKRVHWKKRGDFKKQIISSTGDMDYSDHDAPEVIRVDDQ